MGRGHDLHRFPGGQLVDPTVFLPRRSALWVRLLGIFSRFALWRIDRDPVRCTDCDLCLKSCEGASDPQGDLRKSECFVCLNCIEDCPHDALSFRFLPRKASEVAYPAVGRRELVLSGLFGLFFFPMARLSGGVRRTSSAA